MKKLTDTVSWVGKLTAALADSRAYGERFTQAL